VRPRLAAAAEKLWRSTTHANALMSPVASILIP
jgi:hypothetical protein